LSDQDDLTTANTEDGESEFDHRLGDGTQKQKAALIARSDRRGYEEKKKGTDEMEDLVGLPSHQRE
jgi:hypothetical protein